MTPDRPQLVILTGDNHIDDAMLDRVVAVHWWAGIDRLAA